MLAQRWLRKTQDSLIKSSSGTTVTMTLGSHSLYGITSLFKEFRFCSTLIISYYGARSHGAILEKKHAIMIFLGHVLWRLNPHLYNLSPNQKGFLSSHSDSGAPKSNPFLTNALFRTFELLWSLEGSSLLPQVSNTISCLGSTSLCCSKKVPSGYWNFRVVSPWFTFCFYRGPEFRSQHLHGVTHSGHSSNSVASDILFWLSTVLHSHLQSHMQTITYTCVLNK